MVHPIETRLSARGVDLPEAAKPVASYSPYVIDDASLYISGQLPIEDGRIAVSGRLGESLQVEDGQRAARLCALQILSQARMALSGFERIKGLIKITGFVASTPTFVDQPKVINGASDFFVDVMGECGQHARSAVGVSSLPLGAAVEIEAIFALQGTHQT